MVKNNKKFCSYNVMAHITSNLQPASNADMMTYFIRLVPLTKTQ